MDTSATQDGVHMTAQNLKLYEQPAYGISEAAVYLKVPVSTLRYWLGSRNIPPIIQTAASDPVRLSFMNLLESHALAAMTKLYNLKLPKVRAALRNITEQAPQPHPLVTQVFLTDRKHHFIQRVDTLCDVATN